MTIDEMIEFILYFLQGRRNGKNAGLQIIKALKELKWYREQDLIRREDASYVFCDEPIIDTDGTCYGLRTPSMATLQERILKIPKAEPPICSKMEQVGKDINVPRNEPHKPTEWVGRDSASIPYTPKE